MTKGNCELRWQQYYRFTYRPRDGSINIQDKYDTYSWRAENWSYVLDQMAQLEIVPMTAFREVNREMRSMQYVVKDAKAGDLNLRSQYKQMYPRGFERLFFLDFILKNKDRHADNYLMLPGRQVAIDNGMSDGGMPNNYDRRDGGIDYNHFERSLTPEIAKILKPYLANLNAIPEEEFYRRLGEFATAKAVYNMIERRNRLDAAVNGTSGDIRPKLDCRLITTKGDIYFLFEGLDSAGWLSTPQISGFKPINKERTDITSNGKTLLEFLNGHRLDASLATTFAQEISRARFSHIEGQSNSLLSYGDYVAVWKSLLMQPATKDPVFLKAITEYFREFSPDDEILSNRAFSGIPL